MEGIKNYLNGILELLNQFVLPESGGEKGICLIILSHMDEFHVIKFTRREEQEKLPWLKLKCVDSPFTKIHRQLRETFPSGSNIEHIETNQFSATFGIEKKKLFLQRVETRKNCNGGIWNIYYGVGKDQYEKEYSINGMSYYYSLFNKNGKIESLDVSNFSKSESFRYKSSLPNTKSNPRICYHLKNDEIVEKILVNDEKCISEQPSIWQRILPFFPPPFDVGIFDSLHSLTKTTF
jgi:hypothetical protein